MFALVIRQSSTLNLLKIEQQVGMERINATFPLPAHSATSGIQRKKNSSSHFLFFLVLRLEREKRKIFHRIETSNISRH